MAKRRFFYAFASGRFEKRARRGRWPYCGFVGKFYRPKKETVTIRLDADVLAWLKSTGSGY
jgi:uncharacterized protein (DUF4415 family)